jgi:hypothetical protein
MTLGAGTKLGRYEIREQLGVGGMVSKLHLARAWAAAAREGDTATKENALVSARKAYQDFLAMWKDADPNNTLLQQAKAEYSKLN